MYFSCSLICVCFICLWVFLPKLKEFRKWLKANVFLILQYNLNFELTLFLLRFCLLIWSVAFANNKCLYVYRGFSKYDIETLHVYIRIINDSINMTHSVIAMLRCGKLFYIKNNIKYQSSFIQNKSLYNKTVYMIKN